MFAIKLIIRVTPQEDTFPDFFENRRVCIVGNETIYDLRHKRQREATSYFTFAWLCVMYVIVQGEARLELIQ